MREAVKALREKGLVEAYSGRGTFITDGTTQAVRQSLDLMVKIGQPEGSSHLAEVRAILEPEIAALAATRIQESELATMREAVAIMDRAGQDPDAYIEADLDFHLALAEGAANPLDPLAARFDRGSAARAAPPNFSCAGRPGARPSSSQAHSRSSGAARCRKSAGSDARHLSQVTG